MVTVPNVRLPLNVTQSSIPGQQPGTGAANNIHEFYYPDPCMPVQSIHTMSMSSEVSHNLKTKIVSLAYVVFGFTSRNYVLGGSICEKNLFL